MTIVKVSYRGTCTIHAPDCGHLKQAKPSNKAVLRVRSLAEVFRFSWNRPCRDCGLERA